MTLNWHQVLDKLLELGCTHWDTADVYVCPSSSVVIPNLDKLMFETG